MRRIVAFLILFLAAQSCFGWSEGGQHLIASMAFDLLKPEHQAEVIEILKSHPRFSEDFAKPEKLTDAPKEINRWLIGRAGYWPDLARHEPFDRPTWHYQLGSTLTIGEPKDVPANPGPLPEEATMDTQELHIAQAVELCREILKDKTHLTQHRALAICWLVHLVADAHQPCHAGSLYSPVAFPEGDRSANSIPTRQSNNLHSLWDGLLGPKFDEGDLRRRRREIIANRDLVGDAKKAANQPNGLDPLTWLAESSELARTFVYTSEVMEPVLLLELGLIPKLEPIDVSEAYLKAAGDLARKRAAYAAYRLAAILADGVNQ
jgi:hypothetical protein